MPSIVQRDIILVEQFLELNCHVVQYRGVACGGRALPALGATNHEIPYQHKSCIFSCTATQHVIKPNQTWTNKPNQINLNQTKPNSTEQNQMQLNLK